MKIFLLFYMCGFAVGLTHCYKTTVFFTFIIYINDLPYVVKIFANISLFADDAKLSKHNTIRDSLELQEATTALYAWSKMAVRIKY